ncbi:unnamed protein product [Peniophora sp. CBMAI 1063]|nr:unnamed protein product [Peniophora sp. CBMAI 1063]
MGKQRKGTQSHKAYKPRAGELFNVILSMQYRGRKADDFKPLSFSSAQGIQQAIRALELEDDLRDMGLPRLKGVDCISRSSFGNPFTLEILFPDCDAGQPSEMSFHSFYKRYSEDPRALEYMDIKSIYIYFLPRTRTRLDRSCYAPYVLNRPKDGWKAWDPEKYSNVNGYLVRSGLDLTPSGRIRAQSPSSARHESPDTARTPREGPSSGSLARYASDFGTAGNQPSSPNATVDPRTRPLLPITSSLAEQTPPLAATAISSASTSIADAIQSFSKLITQKAMTAESPIAALSSIPPITDVPTSSESDPNCSTELDGLRAELQQSSTQRDLQRIRIRELQQELATEREVRLKVEDTLQEERELLATERRRLDEAQQECQARFLAPALLDAFLGATVMAHSV